MTLNTFHFAGVSAKNVTLGVPRLRELIDVNKHIRTPGLTIYLRPGAAQDATKATALLNQLEHATLSGITAATEIYFDPSDQATVVPQDAEFLQAYSDLPAFGDAEEEGEKVQSNWVLRVVLDKRKKQMKGISNEEIAEKIAREFGSDLSCVFNSDNADWPVLRIRVQSSEREEGEEGDMAAELCVQDDAFLKRVQTKLLENLALRGVKGITKVFMQKVPRKLFVEENEEFSSKTQEWVLDTEGVNLREVITLPEVDYTRTISNDIVEMLSVFGIEAARMALFNEIKNVISFDGSYVNSRHLMTLVDSMTYRGKLMSVTRNGINRIDTGPIMRSTFEQTAEILRDAALFAERDTLNGVSENVMFGKLAPAGTGAFDLFLNEAKLAHADAAADDNDLEYDLFGGDLYDALSPSLATPSYEMATPAHSPSSAGVFSPIKGDFSPLQKPAGGSASCSVHSSAMSPGFKFSSDGQTSPASPSYSPTSPTYSPTSPSYSPTSPSYSPTSPTYSPTSPTYSPTSPTYSPTSPTYSPTPPSYSPTSPSYLPTSPKYVPTVKTPMMSRSEGTGVTGSPTSGASSPEVESSVSSPSTPKFDPSVKEESDVGGDGGFMSSSESDFD